MLTFEAVARAVSVLEGGGSGMLAQLLAPLELMTRHQAGSGWVPSLFVVSSKECPSSHPCSAAAAWATMQMRFDPSVRDRMAGKREADSEW
ncbi:hypothetical protein HaLaN_32494, partial [Haematococcus lacustris]